MSRVTLNLDETKLAELIMSGVGADTVRVCSDDRDSLRFAVASPQLKLRSVVLGRAALRRLLRDPALLVKIEYLQRELQQAAGQRTEYAYPRGGNGTACPPARMPSRLARVR